MQAFADALKLILKEYVAPTQANFILFFLGPVVTLIFALLGYVVIPYGPGLSLSDMELGILFMLAVSSLATYGILLAGFTKNSPFYCVNNKFLTYWISRILFKSKLEAKHIFLKCKYYITLYIKYERTTTNRRVHNWTK